MVADGDAGRSSHDAKPGRSYRERPTLIPMAYLDRFVHPRLAALTTFGGVVWLSSFLVAAGGLAFRELGNYELAVTLFAVSGWLGFAGLLVLSISTVWFVGLYVRRFLRNRRG
ncbi:hypothetical protein VB779_18145 [Haloarculaceae archaeon H-GB11]|nr:hypothetical protein [Haloarculaceae archaeon H-GB11]